LTSPTTPPSPSAAAPAAAPASVRSGFGGADDLLLEVTDLQTHFITRDAVSRAVDGVSFRMRRGRTLGMVGESGCGKSVTSLSILRLVPNPPGRIVGGSIVFKGRDLLALSEKEMRRVRGAQISMIFQEPMTSLNPVFTVGAQVAEVFRIHRKMSRRDAMAEAVGMLEQVRIPEAARRAREYPHQMSGGMRQRVMIAMALACKPDLLIADEPTTALDVTVQAQILSLMQDLQREFGASILLITHDLGIIAETSDDVAIMYAGQIVELSPTPDLYRQPLHPYTQGLMRSVPRIEMIQEGRPLVPIPGLVPNPAHHPTGCRFHPRCPYATTRCVQEVPSLDPAADMSAQTPASPDAHHVRCHRWRAILADPTQAAATADAAPTYAAI
jgi:oligopeptide/dipeptide ABC transporter ATP-binding protein